MWDHSLRVFNIAGMGFIEALTSRHGYSNGYSNGYSHGDADAAGDSSSRSQLAQLVYRSLAFWTGNQKLCCGHVERQNSYST